MYPLLFVELYIGTEKNIFFADIVQVQCSMSPAFPFTGVEK